MQPHIDKDKLRYTQVHDKKNKTTNACSLIQVKLIKEVYI